MESMHRLLLFCVLWNFVLNRSRQRQSMKCSVCRIKPIILRKELLSFFVDDVLFFGVRMERDLEN